MQTALKDIPIQNYEIPDNVMVHKIKSDTGTPANENEEGVNEYFYSEFPPHEVKKVRSRLKQKYKLMGLKIFMKKYYLNSLNSF